MLIVGDFFVILVKATYELPKITFIAVLIFICSCIHEKELYAVEKPFTLIRVDTIRRGNDTRWKLTFSSPDSLKITIFRSYPPNERVGETSRFPVILANWEKN